MYETIQYYPQRHQDIINTIDPKCLTDGLYSALFEMMELGGNRETLA